MKSKLKFVIPLAVLLLLGGVYQVVLAKPAKPVKAHVEGQVYVMPKEFLINLADGHYVKINVALVLPDGVLPAAGAEGGATPPDGYGALPQEAVVRAVITDAVTNASGRQLQDRKGRNALRAKCLKGILTKTDVKAKDVLFTDVAVQ